MAVGDFDADGYGDLAVSSGGPYANGGTVDVYLGSASGLVSRAHRHYSGSLSFGAGVAIADVNGDGYDDLVVSDDSGAGRIDVYHGGPLGLGPVPNTVIVGAAGSFLGRNLGRAGDVNGDCYDDIGALTGIGGVDVYHGSAVGLQTVVGNQIPAPAFGWQAKVGTMGDLDVDGFDDMGVGDPEGGYSDGSVRIYRGSALGVDPGIYANVDGSYDALGAALSGVVDIDNNGVFEALVGAPGDWSSFGEVDVIENVGGLLVKRPLVTSSHIGDEFGTALAWLGDTDGDGFGELAVGAPRFGDSLYGPGGPEGRIVVYNGSANWVAPSSFEIIGVGDWTGFSGALAGPVDFNGDGLGDLVAGLGSVNQVQVRMAYLVNVDGDGDGYTSDVDCNDADPTIHPGAVERCDPEDVDEDCSGQADGDDPSADPGSWSDFFPDADGDGVGTPGVSVAACDPPVGMAPRDDDCDDADPFRSTGALEICGNGIDEDCDGVDPACLPVPCGAGAATGTGTGTGTGGTPRVPWEVHGERGAGGDPEAPDRGPKQATECGCAVPAGSPTSGLVLALLLGVTGRRRSAS